ncbi:MAG: carboxypeptidase-like regulatory domain-containing protein, partial [Thermonemataceae bacterium]|nr:carboxypeptidase-like regulatory domain-containing protein [Thermonemataceae bacterium]
MQKISFIFFILSLLQIEKGYSQVQGYVVDFDTKEPVEYVSIRSLKSNKSTFSDKKGFFYFDNIANGDTLLFVSLGHQKKRMAVSELKDTINIHSELIEPIFVKDDARKNTKLLGDLRKPHNSIFFQNTNFSIGLVKRKKNSNIIVSFIENIYK